MLVLAALTACRSEPPDARVDRLIRASMTLRGVRPDLGELALVRDDPAAFDALARAWVLDPRFGDTVRDQHAEQLLLRYDSRPHAPPVGPLAAFSEADTVASLDEEALRLVERVVMSGQPYPEIVTTDVAMANPITAAAYGQEWDPSWSGWHPSRYLDGRPMAGILSTTSLLQRYMNSDTNHHRGRANLVLSALLCDPVAGAVVSDPTIEDVSEAPACIGCHERLDPLGSAFYGFGKYFVEDEIRSAYAEGCPDPAACYPLRMWDPARVADREPDAMPAPGLDGVPVSDLESLGDVLSTDPRFASCTARRFLSYFEQVPVADVDESDVERFTDVFLDAGADARELALAIATDPALAPGITPPRRVRPETLSRLMDDLAGWRWEAVPAGYGLVDHAATDEFGFRSMMGGVDGWSSVRPDLHPTATRELGLDWLAAEAASVAVDAGRLPPDSPPGGPRDVDRGLRDLHLLLLGETHPDLGPSRALYDGALARSGDRTHAWKVVVTAMLLDERLVTY